MATSSSETAAKGRKRHVVTDTTGLLVGAEAHPADMQDRDGAPLVIAAIHDLFPWLRHLSADSAYAGDKLLLLERLDDFLAHFLGIAEQHHRVVAVEELVLDPGIARGHRALDE